jgi:hypothetical protein
MKPPVDLNRPIQNPGLVKALERLAETDTDEARRSLIAELNAAHYLVPVFMDEAKLSSNSPGEATVRQGSIIKVLHCEDDQGQVWLGLFTDWDQIRAWTDAAVDTLVMPAKDAWEFASPEQYVGAVLNPANHGLPIDQDRLGYLRSLFGPEAG